MPGSLGVFEMTIDTKDSVVPTQKTLTERPTGIEALKEFKEKFSRFGLDPEFLDNLDKVDSELKERLTSQGNLYHSDPSLKDPHGPSGFDDYIERAKRGEDFLTLGLNRDGASTREFYFMYAKDSVSILICEGLGQCFLKEDGNLTCGNETIAGAVIQRLNLMLSKAAKIPKMDERAILIHGFEHNMHIIRAKIN